MTEGFDITVARAELAELSSDRPADPDFDRAVALAALLLADRDALAGRIAAAHEMLSSIDGADDETWSTLESTVHYVVSHCRALTTAEAQAADEVDRLRKELAEEIAAHASTRRALDRALAGTVR